MDNFATFHQIYSNICLKSSRYVSIKLDRVSFETNGRQNLQKTADFLIESIVFCPLVPPSWISLVDPSFAMYASAIYVSYIYASNTCIFVNIAWKMNCDILKSKLIFCEWIGFYFVEKTFIGFASEEVGQRFAKHHG